MNASVSRNAEDGRGETSSAVVHVHGERLDPAPVRGLPHVRMRLKGWQSLPLTRWRMPELESQMPDTFWSDLVVALIATSFGAILTVAIALWTYRREVWTRERDAIHHLANILANRRALLPARPERVNAALPQYASDLEACRQSVQHARDAVVEASRAIRPGSPAQVSLDAMTRASNDFLSSSRRDPDGYWLQLNALRQEFTASLYELRQLVQRELPEPGSRGRTTRPVSERAS